MKETENRVMDFFLLAREQSRRVAGAVRAGDRHLRTMQLYHPSANGPLEGMVRGLTVSQALRVSLIDWWTNGSVSAPQSMIKHRVMRWVRDDVPDLHTRVNDLPTLHALGTIGLNPEAPCHTMSWDVGRVVLSNIERAKVRSMGVVFDHAASTLGERAILHLMRAMRPHYADVPDPHWIWLTPEACCGLSWAMRNAPYGLHPSRHRQDEARVLVVELLERSREEALWPADDHPFTVDSIAAWCEFVWVYLQIAWPHLKTPVQS